VERAFGDQGVHVGMEVGGVTAEGLDRRHDTHAGVAIVDRLA
jgi:hypothetical protein